MTAPEPGRAFRETLHERWAARGHCVDTRPWEALPEIDREDLEAAVQVAIGTRIAGLEAERDRLAESCRVLERAAERRERALFAAWIDVRHGDKGDAGEILEEALDGYDGPQWNGTETGVQWLERTRALGTPEWERLDDLAREGYASGDTQADWEAAAQAVLNQAFPGLRQQIADLKRERDDLADQLTGLRDRIDSMARGLDMSARSTAPSKKSEIESSVADALFSLLRIDGESIADTRKRLGVPQ